MINFSNSVLDKLIFHKVGNKFNNEDILLSNELLNPNENDYEVFLSSFQKPFISTNDVYHFIHHSDINLNDMFSFSSEIFEEDDSFGLSSKKIAKHLYEQSNHPQIKEGELIIAYFNEIEYNGITTDAIGIYKIERKNNFFKTGEANGNIKVEVINGIDPNKFDKACLIMQNESEDGFRIISVDRNNYDANYWVRDFLNIELVDDSYQYTKNYLSLTEKFVSNKLDNDYELNKSDKVNLLNKTVDFFKKNEVFDENNFAQNIFGNPQVIDSFKKYKDDFSKENNIAILDDFSISQNALKKQMKIFKAIIKLDKNFHVYVHGNGDLIEKGYDSGIGKSFYKIYFDNES